MTPYLDTSTILRAILRDGPLLPAWGIWDSAYTSAIFDVEARRTLDRLRLTNAYGSLQTSAALSEIAEIGRTLNAVPVSSAVLERAGQPMPSVVRTLDAIHLATALLVREHVEPLLAFATHDYQQATAARAFGFEVIGLELA